MNDKVFKSNLFTIILVIFIKTLVIIIPAFIVATLLIDVLPVFFDFDLFQRLFYYFNNWKNLELVIVFLAFVYSISYAVINKVSIIIDGKYFIYIRNNKKQIFDISSSQILFREKVEDVSIIGKLSSNYTIQIIGCDGYNKEICCYCFNKKDYAHLKKIIKQYYKEENK